MRFKELLILVKVLEGIKSLSDIEEFIRQKINE
jgi:hypothetical protein